MYCPKCKRRDLPDEAFYTNPARSSRHSSYCKSCNRKHVRDYRKTPRGKEVHHDCEQRRRVKTKNVVMSYYSGGVPECACPGCKDQHLEFLTMDHINEDGAQHRREVLNQGKQGCGRKIYDWLIHNGYPEGFQVLCFNCNFAKHAFGVCPHVKETVIW